MSEYNQACTSRFHRKRMLISAVMDCTIDVSSVLRLLLPRYFHCRNYCCHLTRCVHCKVASVAWFWFTVKRIASVSDVSGTCCYFLTQNLRLTTVQKCERHSHSLLTPILTDTTCSDCVPLRHFLLHSNTFMAIPLSMSKINPILLISESSSTSSVSNFHSWTSAFLRNSYFYRCNFLCPLCPSTCATCDLCDLIRWITSHFNTTISVATVWLVI